MEDSEMKLKKEFISHTTGGQQVMVSSAGSGFSGLVRSNATAAFIVDQLKKETTAEQIIETMLAEYDAPREIISRDVHMVIDTLRGIGALDE